MAPIEHNPEPGQPHRQRHQEKRPVGADEALLKRRQIIPGAHRRLAQNDFARHLLVGW